ncbi:hypothetical protein BD626DRAFT_449543 [Schizophyllum amplum]|uniref:ATPase AAA-type core domain-containing protein n=1 Tax=Schizophyllum amplum TaxID=97359 RepID=A0A550CS36_9AGAR|nr:hypothetical protein BD626DRAFT_449543 [Auriculariopsis ampla]
MPPKKKSNSKGSLKSTSSQQRTLFDHFQKKGRPDADAPTTPNEGQESRADTLPSSPSQGLDSEPAEAPVEAATASSPPASSPWTNPPPSSGPPSSPPPIEVETDDEKAAPAALAPPVTPKKVLKPNKPSTPLIGTSRDAPIVIASSPGTSRPAHPFFAPRIAPRSPSKVPQIALEEAPPAFPDRDSQHIRGPQALYATASGRIYPPRQSAPRDVDDEHTNMAFLKIRLDVDVIALNVANVSDPDIDLTERQTYLSTIPDYHRAHPAISRALQDNANEDDKAQSAWSQQSLPKTAQEVLGNERNAMLLRDWLRTLQLDVSSATNQTDLAQNAAQQKAKPKAPKRTLPPPKRRGRKRVRIDSDDDNFSVSTPADYEGEDEEEEEEWDPIGGDDDDFVPSRLHRKGEDTPISAPATPALPASASAPVAPPAYAPTNGATGNPYAYMMQPSSYTVAQPGTYYNTWASFTSLHSQHVPYAPYSGYAPPMQPAYAQPAPSLPYTPYGWPVQASTSVTAPPPTIANYAPLVPTPTRTHARSAPPVLNAILLAGPPGSGKTAAVYACAAELGFEIFEVYPGIGRRNGVSVDHLVGNVGRNHLVRQAASETKTGTKSKNAFAALMKSKIPEEDVPEDTDSSPQTPKENSATFRQSLILLEEVDILFKEDTNFWPSLVTFIKSSRRPVVLTCNDLSIVPLGDYDIPLQQVLHFSRCPAPLATSLLQSLCYQHAQLVPREDVARFCDICYDAEDTRAASGCDLRHAINALQLHCTTRRHHAEEEDEVDVIDWDDSIEAGGGDPVIAAAARSMHRRRQAVHSEILSFMDAHACMRDLGKMDPWARSAPAEDDELGHQVLFDLPAHPDVGAAFRGRVDELATTAARLSARAARETGVAGAAYLPPSPPPRSPACYGARALFRARVGVAEHVPRLRGMRALARAGGGEALYLDYLPYVRQMAAMDDVHEWNAINGGMAQEGAGARVGRTTRNSAKAAYVRTVFLTQEERAALAATALVE